MKKPLKILIIRFSSIGDIVLTTPVIRCLKEQLPGVEIHYLTKAKYFTVLQGNPHIDRFHLLGDSLRAMYQPLHQENFDEIIDLHSSLRSLVVKKSLGVKTHSVNKINVQKWIAVNFKKDILPELHIVDRYLKTVAHLGVKNDGKGLDHYVWKDDIMELTDLPSALQNGFVALALGGQFSTKRMPTEKLVELCTQLKQPIALLGGNEDKAIGELIERVDPERIWNACGKLNLNQSASVVKMSEKVITHDTGMMHIAAAFNKEIISIWGNTIPQFGMTPYLPSENASPSHIIEVKGLSCRPCSKIGYDTCPKEHFDCMQKIPVEEISKMVNL